MRRAATLVEMLFFGAIASALLVLVIGFFTRGAKFIELGRRTSGAQTDLRAVLEALSEDSAEIIQFDGSGDKMDASGTFSFKIYSSRAEKGIAAGKPSTRTVTYKLEGQGKLKDVTRTVAEQGGGSGTETLAHAGIATLNAWPIAAVPRGKTWVMKPGTAAEAHQAGATPACLLVEISAGEEAGEAKTQVEKDTLSKIVTKLWCRNRVLELARGALR